MDETGADGIALEFQIRLGHERVRRSVVLQRVYAENACLDLPARRGQEEEGRFLRLSHAVKQKLAVGAVEVAGAPGLAGAVGVNRERAEVRGTADESKAAMNNHSVCDRIM